MQGSQMESRKLSVESSALVPASNSGMRSLEGGKSKVPLDDHDSALQPRQADWAAALDAATKRRSQVLAPGNLENMWAIGRNYQEKMVKVKHPSKEKGAGGVDNKRNVGAAVKELTPSFNERITSVDDKYMVNLMQGSQMESRKLSAESSALVPGSNSWMRSLEGGKSKVPLDDHDSALQPRQADWLVVLDAATKRRSQVPAPENLENMWAIGRNYQERMVKVEHPSKGKVAGGADNKRNVGAAVKELTPNFNERITSVDIKSTRNVLDDILDGREKPTNVPLALLEDITERFSDKRIIGRGGFGVVYKGVLYQNRGIAVKKLLNSGTMEDGPFYKEVNFLMNVEHPNIVRFLGFCANTVSTSHKVESGILSKYIYPEIRERLLCFEYISKGSLDNHLTDELRGLECYTRYQIIRGICDGMQYLHEKKRIVHMDLKPANVLLDDLMVPKITDFGISRYLDGVSRHIATQRLGSLGYCSPEYILHGEVSFESDIYSLGIIITDLITGRKGIPDMKNVLRRWRYRWNKSGMYPAMGYEQVTRCIEIALSCTSVSPKERPYISDIVSMLSDATGSKDENIGNVNVPTIYPISPYSWELLEFEQLELHFPYEVNKQIPCSFQVTNERDDYHIAFHVQISSILQYCIEPDKGIVPPRCKRSVIVTLQPQVMQPCAMVCKDQFDVRCAIVDGDFTVENITENTFDAKSGAVVDNAKLTVSFLPRAKGSQSSP